MSHSISSRREFLQQSAAALSFGGALSLAHCDVFAREPVPKKTAIAARQAVACSREEAAEAAGDVLRQGGNAVDAAVAALLVQCVVEPSKVGVGGYGASLSYYQSKSGQVHALESTTRAPKKLDPASLTQTNAQHGYMSVGAPGIIAGIDSALREYGTMPFKTLAKHAVVLAEDGAPVTPGMAQSFASLKNMDPVSRRAYFPNGVPAEGAEWKQPDLARLLRRLGDEGLGSFYKGEIAATIAKQVQAGGGVLTEDDFRDFHASNSKPLHINYRGYDLYTPPLPSGGLTTLTILKTLEQFDLSKLDPWGAPYFELFAAASNLAWDERNHNFGDPEFVKLQMDEFLSEKRAVDRAEVLRRHFPSVSTAPAESSHTVNIVVVDKDQNVASWTATHGDDFGAHVAIEGLGLMLGHGMSRFDLDKSHPNRAEPGKRPQHNMSPVVILRDGKPYGAVGMPGGTRIVTVTAQIIMSLIDFKATPQQAVDAPRLHSEGADPIKVNHDVPEKVINELKSHGHSVEYLEPLGGPANVALIAPKTGNVQAAASKPSTGVLVF